MLASRESDVVPAGLATSCEAAADAAVAKEAPGRKIETWRFTNLAKLFALRCASDKPEPTADSVRDTVARLTPAEAGTVLVFVDGRLCAAESVLDSDAEAIVAAGGYIGGIDGFEGDLAKVLGVLDKEEGSAASGTYFATVSSALARDVAILEVPAGFKPAKPVAVIFISSGGEDKSAASVSATRLAILAGADSELTLLEAHSCADMSKPWGCAVGCTGVDVSGGADVSHYLLNDAARDAHHVAHVHADVAKNGSYKARSLALGGQVGRVELGIDLNEKGAHGEVCGVMIADGKRVADLHSRISHNAPWCTSKQYQKNIASENGRVVFSGRILVKKVAQETSSEQLCRSMLLSNKARVDAMPVLEISADQVKCTHGATVSDLSQEELFYCQSRGISESVAQELLIASFTADALEDCPFESLRSRTNQAARALIPTIQKIDPVEREGLFQSV